MSTLYPPLIDTFMPAFLREGPAIAAFSISPYNSESDIQKIHISLVDQATNTNALAMNNTAAGLQPGNGTLVDGIWIIDIKDTKFIHKNTITNLYTLKIPKSILKSDSIDIEDKSFNITNYYKLQLRFDSSTEELKSDYLLTNRQYFSEWSSVSLLKAIPDFDIILDGFDDSETDEDPSFNAGTIQISGRVSFNNNLIGKNAETLRSYSINIFDKDDLNNPVASSGDIFTGDSIDPNRIYWLADMENAVVGGKYKLVVSVITKNQYATNKSYNFEIYDYDATPFDVEWKFNKVELEKYNITSNGKIVTEEDGIVKFNVKTVNSMPPGYLYIKRASSLDNYQKWDLISCTKENGAVDRDFEDMTVGSLVRYKYSAQYQLKKGSWTRSKKTNEIVYPDFYDMLISRNGRQLAIRYDAKITSMKPVVNRQKIDTLGGKYPKFAENANMNYKQYSINGYIDAESDYNRRFLNERDYQIQMDDYDSQIGGKYEIRNDTIPDGEYNYPYTHQEEQRNTVHDIYPKDNWWLEREFREQAVQWLNDGEPKLFRSMTEGNIVVMLTDINLTPNQTVSRRLYNFTATMYEIENGYNLQTLNSLGIVNIQNDKEITNIHDGDEEGGDEEEDEDTDLITITTVGQMYSQYMEPSSEGEAKIINGVMGADATGKVPCGISGFDYRHASIQDLYNNVYYEPYSVDGSRHKVKEGSIELKNLTIQFESKPTWWSFDSKNMITYVEDDGTQKTETTALGYKIAINGNDIFVNEKGYYQVPSKLAVKNLSIYGGAIATLNYIITYKLEFNDSTIPSQTKLAAKVVSQLSGIWMPGVKVSPLIERKHKWTKYAEGRIVMNEFLSSWTALTLEVTPYAVAAVQYDGEENFNNYVVGRTGIYNLVDDYAVKEMYFMGRRMVRSTGHKTPYLDEWEFVLDKSAIKDKSQFKEWEMTWDEFINRRVQETETLVDINNVVSIADDQGINRLWNNATGSTIPVLGGYEESVKHPEYNTVYGFKNKDGSISYKIFYIDNYWYNVTFYDKEQTILLAEVPIHGMINYRGDLIRQKY